MKEIINKIKELTARVVVGSTLAITTIAFVSCDKQIYKNSTPMDMLTIRFQAPPSISVETETKAATISGVEIVHVYVLQYSEDGTMLRKESYPTDKITSVNQNEYVAQVETKGFSNVNSRFYVIVNGEYKVGGSGDLLLNENSYTEAELKAVTKQITEVTSVDPGYMTAGPIKFEAQDVDNGKAILVAPLERAYSQFDVSYTTSLSMVGTFVVEGCTIGNSAKYMSVSKRGGSLLSTDVYPDNNMIEGSEIYIPNTDNSWASNTIAKCYLAENLRGFGKSTTFAGKNIELNGPGGTLSLCSYIKLIGIYKYDNAHVNGIKVEYKFYLGGNFMNDYNVQRGTKYSIVMDILGANSADVRVTITDGNVIIFDKVQSITNNIEFN